MQDDSGEFSIHLQVFQQYIGCLFFLLFLRTAQRIVLLFLLSVFLWLTRHPQGRSKDPYYYFNQRLKGTSFLKKQHMEEVRVNKCLILQCVFFFSNVSLVLCGIWEINFVNDNITRMSDHGVLSFAPAQKLSCQNSVHSAFFCGGGVPNDLI